MVAEETNVPGYTVIVEVEVHVVQLNLLFGSPREESSLKTPQLLPVGIAKQ